MSKFFLISFSQKRKTQNQYSSCEVIYHDPKLKKLITSNAKGNSIKADVLKINSRCENKEQAKVKAKAGINKVSPVEGTITIMGNPYLVAGLNIELKGLYHLSGKYHIKTSKHSIDRMSGYKTELEIEKC